MSKKKAVIVTGSGGLVGSSFIEHFLDGHPERFIYGIDNDSRRLFFGPRGSTESITQHLRRLFPNNFRTIDLDIRHRASMEPVFGSIDIQGVVHAAGQPSHDYAMEFPFEDFDINARGTLMMLDLTRAYAPMAPFIFLSSNKVYGDWPNRMIFRETETRFEPKTKRFRLQGLQEHIGTDRVTHSLYGCSKLAADIYVQEYGRIFGHPVVILRCGCITGAAHRGVEKHGFLSHLVRSLIAPERSYEVIGFGGKQVRDSIDARDLAEAIGIILEFRGRIVPMDPVFNMGGGPDRTISVLEAIKTAHKMIEHLGDRKFRTQITFNDKTRMGDHRWWATDFSRFQSRYPEWSGPTKTVEDQIREITLAALSDQTE